MHRYLSPALLYLLFFFATARADTFLVLPFFNGSKSPNLNWVGDSISETISEALSSQGMVVLPREDRQEVYRRLSVRQYSILTHATVMKIGEALDATNVIYGQFDVNLEAQSTSKTSLRISARVLDLKSLKQSPAFGEVGPLDELAALQQHMAWQVLGTTSAKTRPSEDEFKKRLPTVRLDALESYIRGLLAPAADQKMRFFTQAARLDPNFSPPCFQLGRLSSDRKSYPSAIDWLQRVSTTDPHYREAQFLLGICRYRNSDFTGAQHAFQIVAASVPLNEVLNNLAAAQSRRSLPEAIDNFIKALDGDPRDPVYHFNVGYALWKHGEFSAAAERFRAVLDRDPNDAEAILLLGRCLQNSGPRPGDSRVDGLERLKTEYQETAYLQLKELLETKQK